VGLRPALLVPMLAVRVTIPPATTLLLLDVMATVVGPGVTVIGTGAEVLTLKLTSPKYLAVTEC
jgi:hypothetical protein